MNWSCCCGVGPMDKPTGSQLLWHRQKAKSLILRHGHAQLEPPRGFKKKTTSAGGRDESKRRRAESQWIVAARPLCHLQYPVAYLSRLQRILYPPLDGNCASRRLTRLVRRASFTHDTCLWGLRGPYCWSANGRQADASLLARILT